MDGSLPGSSDHGILQSRMLEWVADPGIKPGSPALQANSLPFEPPLKVKLPLNQTFIKKLTEQC